MVQQVNDLAGNSPAQTLGSPRVSPRGLNVYDTNQQGGSATVVQIAASATSVTLQAANNARVSVSVVNDSSVTMYVKYGTSASSTSYTHILYSGDEVIISDYTGVVTGVWVSATGYAYVTEVTQ